MESEEGRERERTDSHRTDISMGEERGTEKGTRTQEGREKKPKKWTKKEKRRYIGLLYISFSPVCVRIIELLCILENCLLSIGFEKVGDSLLNGLSHPFSPNR